MILLVIISIVSFLVFNIGFSFRRNKIRKAQPKRYYPYSEVLKESVGACAWCILIAFIPCVLIGMHADTTKTTEVQTQTIETNEHKEPLITGINDGNKSGTYNVDLVFENSEDIETVYNVDKKDIHFTDEDHAYLIEYNAVYTSKIIDFLYVMDPPNENVLYLPRQGYNFSWFSSTGN